MSVTSNDIANAALNLIGDNQPPVTGQNPTWDTSTAGKALTKVYSFVVATVQRQFGWDASRNIAALVPTGNTPPAGWTAEYTYPGNGIEVWQVMPQTPADANNPLPVNWVVGNTLVASVQTKVIWSNQAAAYATYNNNPSEATWDSLFREAVIRLLSSYLAMALEGRPDFAQSMLESGAAFESLNEGRAG